MRNVSVCSGLAFLQVFHFTFVTPKESGRVHGFRLRRVFGCSKLIFDFVVLNSFESGNFDEMMGFEANFVDLKKMKKHKLCVSLDGCAHGRSPWVKPCSKYS